MLAGLLPGVSSAASGLSSGPSGADSGVRGDNRNAQTTFFGGAKKQAVPTWAIVAAVGLAAVYVIKNR